MITTRNIGDDPADFLEYLGHQEEFLRRLGQEPPFDLVELIKSGYSKVVWTDEFRGWKSETVVEILPEA
jgi:hypothetical protein